jgi:hypothetical protein
VISSVNPGPSRRISRWQRRTFTIALSDNYQASEVPRIARVFAARLPRATKSRLCWSYGGTIRASAHK